MNSDKKKNRHSVALKRNVIGLTGILIVLLLTACSNKPEVSEKDEGSIAIEKIDDSIDVQETQTGASADMDLAESAEEETEQIENTERSKDTKQAEKEDVSGIYTDKQGTSDVYSQLTLALHPDGIYVVEISVYRTTELEGTAVWEGDTLRFTSEDPYVLADISVIGSQAEVTVITDAAGVLTGDTYSFPDGAPGECPEQTEEDSFRQNLSEKIAMEISYAEDREKEIEKKQKEADTQMDMNITAAEMHQLWDDTLNIVWGLLEANLDEADMEILRKEEREWIAVKDAEVQAAGQECGGGSIQPSVEATTAADLTKARVYELAEYAK